MHFSNFTMITQRVSLSIAIIAMVNSTQHHGLSNVSTEEPLAETLNNPSRSFKKFNTGVSITCSLYICMRIMIIPYLKIFLLNYHLLYVSNVILVFHDFIILDTAYFKCPPASSLSSIVHSIHSHCCTQKSGVTSSCQTPFSTCCVPPESGPTSQHTHTCYQWPRRSLF